MTTPWTAAPAWVPGARTSFLLRGSALINPDGHRRRLAAAGADQAAITTVLTELRTAAADAGPLLFPQILLGDAPGMLSIDPRPITPDRLSATARLITHPGPDQRTRPHIKGPDFPFQTAVRKAAVRAGADDALLLGPDGTIRETAFGTVVAWRDGALVSAAPVGRLPSTTEEALIAAAEADGLRTTTAPLTPAELRDADAVWLLSALHTIREVTHVDGAPVGLAAGRGATPSRGSFQQRLWAGAQDLRALTDRD